MKVWDFSEVVNKAGSQSKDGVGYQDVHLFMRADTGRVTERC